MLKNALMTLALHVRNAVSDSERNKFDAELAHSGLLEHLDREGERFRSQCADVVVGRGARASIGSSLSMGKAYYYLVRKFRPAVTVETGVCNGISTALILQGLKQNGFGSLHSVDYPEYAGAAEDPEIWSGKGGAAVPTDQQPGWMIPAHLRDDWTLTLGKSTDQLRPLLERLDSIDCFVHDSEHSYECMMFEYSVAWKHLRPGGILASNDITWNRAFFDFSSLHLRAPQFLTKNDAFIRK
jgi:predicted O-methyltransferase YrrM